MRITLTNIGNSHGLILPKQLLEACDIVDSVDVEICGKHLIVSPAVVPRAGWAKAIDENPEIEDWSDWLAIANDDAWD